MLPTRPKVLRRFWYAGMPMAELGDGPTTFALLGENIVLRRDARRDEPGWTAAAANA